jgi:hypothetical protein
MDTLTFHTQLKKDSSKTADPFIMVALSRNSVKPHQVNPGDWKRTADVESERSAACLDLVP